VDIYVAVLDGGPEGYDTFSTFRTDTMTEMIKAEVPGSKIHLQGLTYLDVTLKADCGTRIRVCIINPDRGEGGQRVPGTAVYVVLLEDPAEGRVAEAAAIITPDRVPLRVQNMLGGKRPLFDRLHPNGMDLKTRDGMIVRIRLVTFEPLEVPDANTD
jgi:hypothetical protein